MRRVLLLGILCAILALPRGPARAAEQTVEAITPTGEQQVEGFGPPAEQRVEGVAGGGQQTVEVQVQPTPAAKAVSRAGTIVAGTVAVAATLAATAAMLIFL